MSDPRVDLCFDSFTGTLSLLVNGAKGSSSRESENDSWMVFDVDPQGQIVGLQLALAQDLSLEDWLEHPDRALLPDLLRKSMDAWYRERPANLHVAIDDPQKMAAVFAEAARKS